LRATKKNRAARKKGLTNGKEGHIYKDQRAAEKEKTARAQKSLDKPIKAIYT
jgi:hypothetical protein